MTHNCCPVNHTSKYISEYFRHYLFSWYWLTANVVAIVFSLLCLLVLIRHPRVFASSTRTWFMALIVSDLFILTISANDMYVELMFPTLYHPLLCRVLGRFNSQIRIGTITCLLWISNFLQTGLSMERLASILSPLRTRALSTGSRTRWAIFGLVSFCCVMATILSLVTLKPDELHYNYNNLTGRNEVSCHINRRHLVDEHGNVILDGIKVSYCVDLILLRSIPFALMLISSALIAILIRRQRKQRTKLMCTSNAMYISASQHRESRASLLLLTMNITTLLTNPLFLLFELIDGEGSEGQRMAKLTKDPCISCILRKFFNCLLYVNNQTNWIFYLTFGARFRYHIYNMIRCTDTVRNDHRHSKHRSQFTERFAPLVSTPITDGSSAFGRLKSREESNVIAVPLRRMSSMSVGEEPNKELVQLSEILNEKTVNSEQGNCEEMVHHLKTI